MAWNLAKYNSVKRHSMKQSKTSQHLGLAQTIGEEKLQNYKTVFSLYAEGKLTLAGSTMFTRGHGTQ